MTAVLNVPFAYSADVVTASGEEVRRKYREVARIRVETVEASEVVLRARSRLDKYDTGRGLVDLKLIDGSLYEAMGLHSYLDGWHDLTLAEKDVGGLLLKALENVRPVREAASVRRKGPPKPSTVVTSGREKALERMEGLAGEFVILNGVVHRRVPEPYFVARPGQVGLINSHAEDAEMHVFRLDEINHAIERAALLGQQSQETIARPDVILIDKGWLSHQFDDLSLRAAASYLERSVARGLDNAPIDVMMAFCDLRDAMARRWDDNTESAWAHRIEMADRLRSVVEEFDGPSEHTKIYTHVRAVSRARDLSHQALPTP